MRIITFMALIALASLVHAKEPSANNGDLQLEETVVVASRLPTTQKKVGRALTVLDSVAIDDLGFAYGADLFRVVPGVAISRSGGYGGLTQLRLRGAEANHSVVLIDGIDVTAAGTGEFDFSSLLAADIERIEVLRGPQSGLYGSNALAGVVSITTKSAKPGLHFDATLEGGSHDSQQGGLSLAGGSETIRGRLSFTERKTNFDLSESDGLIGSEEDEDINQTLSGQLLVDVNEALQVKLFGRLHKKDTETDGFDFSGGPFQGLPIDDLSFNDLENQSMGGVIKLSLAEGRFLSQLSYQESESELDGGTFGSDSKRDQVRFDATWLWSSSDLIASQTTVFFEHEDESFTNPYPFDPSQAPTQSRDLSGFGVEQRVEVNNRLFINAVLRQDDNDNFADETTYSADVAYLLNNGSTRVHASYGSGVTNPTFFEQFGFVPGTFVGNPELKPEQSKGWDLGVEHALQNGIWQFGFTYFDADLEDEIQSLFPSVINLDGESERSGVEVSARYRPSEQTEISFQYTYLDADEPGGEEVQRPKHSGSLTAASSFLNNTLRLSGSVMFNGSRLDNDFRNFFTNGFVSERTKLDGFVLVNLNATYAVNETFEVFVRVENLLDEDYEEVIGYATPGASVFAGVRMQLAR